MTDKRSLWSKHLAKTGHVLENETPKTETAKQLSREQARAEREKLEAKLLHQIVAAGLPMPIHGLEQACKGCQGQGSIPLAPPGQQDIGRITCQCCDGYGKVHGRQYQLHPFPDKACPNCLLSPRAKIEHDCIKCKGTGTVKDLRSVDFAWLWEDCGTPHMSGDDVTVEAQGGKWIKGRNMHGWAADMRKSNELQLMGYIALAFDSELINSGEALDTIKQALGVG